MCNTNLVGIPFLFLLLVVLLPYFYLIFREKKKNFKLFNCPLRRRHLVQTRSLNSSWTDYYFVRNFAPPRPKKKKKKNFLHIKDSSKIYQARGIMGKKSNKCFLLSRSYFVTIKKNISDPEFCLTAKPPSPHPP